MNEDRVKHAIAVARKMIQIAKDMGLSENEINDCFIIDYITPNQKYNNYINNLATA